MAPKMYTRKTRWFIIIAVLALYGLAGLLNPILVWSSFKTTVLTLAVAVPNMILMFALLLWLVDQVLKFGFGQSLRELIVNRPKDDNQPLWTFAAALVIAGALFLVALNK